MEHAASPSPFEPEPAAAREVPPVAAAPAREVGPSSEERTLALLAHGLTFLEGGLIGPIVMYLLKRKESDFVAFHALQSVAFSVLYLLITVLTCGLGGVALLIPFVVFEIIACIRAYEGQWYELPVVGGWARRKHPGHAAAFADPTSSARPPQAPPTSPSPPAPSSPLTPAPNPTGAPMPNFF